MSGGHTPGPSEKETIARMICEERGWQFLALIQDISDEVPRDGFFYILPGQDSASPNWAPASLAYSSKGVGHVG